MPLVAVYYGKLTTYRSRRYSWFTDIRASYGTTKYCTYYLRNMTCPNPSCLYLHEPGEEADTISKEELATGKHRMRDQISTDDDDEDDDDDHHHHHYSSSTTTSTTGHLSSSSSYHNVPSISSHDFPPVGTATSAAATSSRKTPTLESVATVSYKSSPARQQSSSSAYSSASNLFDQSGDDDRSALPATASWAKLGSGSGASTPVLKSVVPERALTPDNFGPPLAVAAAAAAQKQQPQPQPQSPSAMKRKIEKKKRKELQRNKDSTAGKSKPTTPSSSSSSIPTTTVDSLSSMKVLNDALVNFVLGDAIDHVGWVPDNDDDEPPLGVSTLYDDNAPTTPPSSSSPPLPPPCLPKEQQPNTVVDTLEFLLNAVPTPPYRGSFNPFAHQILRSSGNLFESPMRKTSRFGFAQM